MPTSALVIWVVTLVVVALVIVPVALVLLRRVLNAAWAIERYLADMKTAGLGVAGHTGAILALDATRDAAAAMQPVAQEIEAKTGAVAQLLAGRAAGRAER